MLHALQQSALMHRKRLVNTRFIGITGSNGKTIVKEWAHQLIESEKEPIVHLEAITHKLAWPFGLEG